MKLKLLIFTFTAILSILFANISCKSIEDPGIGNIIPLEPDYLGEHFTNETPTIPAKILYNYYNSGKYKNKPEQQRVTLYVISDKDETALRIVNIRRVIESPILDIYVDLSDYRGVVQKSVNFGINNWIKLLNSFYDNYQKMTNIYGNHYKGFNGGKIDILFVDLRNDGQSILSGYFAPGDIDGAKYGNNRQILYINSYHLDPDKIDEMMDTIFHEFQHLINYSRVKLNISQKGMKDWLNEALSESTYYITRGNKPNRNRFEGYSRSASIREGKSFYNWIYNSTDSYVTASMFMYWLYLHGGGNKIIKDIAHSDRDIEDYYKVVKAVKNNFPFYYQLQVQDWGSILTSWYSANFSQSSSGLESYLGNYTFYPQIITGNYKINLSPGEGIYISPYLSARYTGNNIIEKSLTNRNNRRATLILNKNSSLIPLTRDEVYLSYKNRGRSVEQFEILDTKPYLDPDIWIDMLVTNISDNININKD